MPLTLRQMEVVGRVLRTGSMSAAGRELSISQPAVSRIVGAAEREVAVRLFVRERNGLTPTPEAVALGREIERVFLNVEAAQSLAGVLAEGAGRVVRIATTPALVDAFVPEAVAAMKLRFPQTRVVVKVREPAPIQEALMRRDFDIGVAYVERNSGAQLASVPICGAPAVVLVPRGHALARRNTIGPRDLDGTPLVSFAADQYVGADIEASFRSVGARRNVQVEAGNSFLAAAFVRRGTLIGLVDPFILGSEAAAGLVAIPFLPYRTVAPQVVVTRGHRISAPEEALIAAILANGAAWRARHFPRYAGDPELRPTAFSAAAFPANVGATELSRTGRWTIRNRNASGARSKSAASSIATSTT